MTADRDDSSADLADRGGPEALPVPPPRREGHRPRRAIVLSGGGARGAYEAGVLRFILDDLPRRTGVQPDFDLICGTSVGAIHACFLAATASPRSGRT